MRNEEYRFHGGETDGGLSDEFRRRRGVGRAEKPLDLGGCLGFVLVLDVGSDGAERGDERAPVVAEAGTGKDVRDQVGGQNQIAQGADDDALGPSRRVAILQAVEKDERGEQGFAPGADRSLFSKSATSAARNTSEGRKAGRAIAVFLT